MRCETEIHRRIGLPPDLRADTPRILMVEDEMTVAMLIEDIANELSYEIAAAVPQLEDAVLLLDSDDFDAAMLDLNLNGKTVFPFAAELDERGVPHQFATAYGGRGIPISSTSILYWKTVRSDGTELGTSRPDGRRLITVSRYQATTAQNSIAKRKCRGRRRPEEPSPG